jgi:hypothetical protein
MKIGLLVSTEAEDDNERQEVARKITRLLEDAGYKAFVTWPESVRKEIIKRI